MKTWVTIKQIAFATLLAGFASCTHSDAEWMETPDEEEGVLVNMNVSIVESQDIGQLRSSFPLPPEKENLIHDIWIFQYDAQGILRERFTQRFREKDSGILKLNSFSARLAPLKNCTVCMVANLNPGEENPPAHWPDTWSQFLEEYTTIAYSSTPDESGLPTIEGLYMFGCYHGDISGSAETPTVINIALGRMLSRLNLTVTNETGVNLSDFKITIENVVTKAYFYPRTENPVFATEDLTSFTSSLSSMASNASTTLYYYVAPNMNPAPGKETRIKVDAKKNGVSVSATVNMGGSLQNTTINRNNNYTISLTLK